MTVKTSVLTVWVSGQEDLQMASQSVSVAQSLQGAASVLSDLATMHFIAKFGCQMAIVM